MTEWSCEQVGERSWRVSAAREGSETLWADLGCGPIFPVPSQFGDFARMELNMVVHQMRIELGEVSPSQPPPFNRPLLWSAHALSPMLG